MNLGRPLKAGIEEARELRRASDAMNFHSVADATQFLRYKAVRALKGPAKFIWPLRGHPGKSLS
jgi:hypothetical protein